MKTDLGKIYSKIPVAHHSSIMWPWQPCEIIKRKRIGTKPCLQLSGYKPCYLWSQTFLVQGIFNLFPPVSYNGYFWSKWIAYFDRKWDLYLASLWQCSRSVSFWVKKSPPLQISESPASEDSEVMKESKPGQIDMQIVHVHSYITLVVECGYIIGWSISFFP